MSAMQEEIQALLHQLENRKSYTKGQRDYYTGTLFGKDTVLVFSRWGKVASATTATQLINDFDLDELIFTGVAGAIATHLNVGDIVIGEKLVQHDMNAFPLYNNFEIPLLNKTYFDTNSTNRDQLAVASQSFLEGYSNVISTSEAQELGISTPKIYVGDIASGDQFISQESQIAYITSHLQTVLCAEMEGAAVAQVCYEYEIPFSIIRIISDKADGDAHIDFPRFTKNIASKYALAILANYFNSTLNH